MRLLLSVGEVVGWLTRGTQRGGDVGRHGLLHVECSVCIGTRRGATRRPLARDGIEAERMRRGQVWRIWSTEARRYDGATIHANQHEARFIFGEGPNRASMRLMRSIRATRTPCRAPRVGGRRGDVSNARVPIIFRNALTECAVPRIVAAEALKKSDCCSSLCRHSRGIRCPLPP